MPSHASHHHTPAAREDDADLIERLMRHDQGAYEVLMRRYNLRLFRVARAILKDDTDAEDVLQESYLAAYRHIGAFRGDASLSTWLTRIVVTQSLMRLRGNRRRGNVVAFHSDAHGGPAIDTIADDTTDTAHQRVLRAELRRLLERRLDALPESFRAVFVMREVEDMTVDETAECLSLAPATVRTRLFRARALLREGLSRDLDIATGDIFGFAGQRCDRIVANVLGHLVETATRPAG